MQKNLRARPRKSCAEGSGNQENSHREIYVIILGKIKEKRRKQGLALQKICIDPCRPLFAKPATIRSTDYYSQAGHYSQH
jgi:hypothetical protein